MAKTFCWKFLPFLTLRMAKYYRSCLKIGLIWRAKRAKYYIRKTILCLKTFEDQMNDTLCFFCLMNVWCLSSKLKFMHRFCKRVKVYINREALFTDSNLFKFKHETFAFSVPSPSTKKYYVVAMKSLCFCVWILIVELSKNNNILGS